MQPSIMGMSWYQREDYDELRTLFVDGGNLPETFDKWLHSAETGEARFRAKGARVVRAIIEPAPFREWCANKNMALDAKARMAYASECAYREFTGGGQA